MYKCLVTLLAAVMLSGISRPVHAESDEVCNEGDIPIEVAGASFYKTGFTFASSDHWVVKGWLTVAPGRCVNFGELAR
jgi:uncharacterized membrane protein